MINSCALVDQELPGAVTFKPLHGYINHPCETVKRFQTNRNASRRGRSRSGANMLCQRQPDTDRRATVLPGGNFHPTAVPADVIVRN